MRTKEPWFKNSVIYAVDVEKYADGNGDGVGDLEGLLQKLDYIEYLGVDALWVLPFYPSPRRDNGYDIIDHYQVDPRLGTLEQFEHLVHSAGERGIRVVIDIVMDHTSDKHPWFQASRRDETSRFRDYYTWSKTPVPGGLTHGSAFPGEESHLWTYDEVARAYYYHPFYRFQPQLNIANPEVRLELTRLIDYWLAFGVSGFRIDAVPLMLGLEGPMPSPPPDPAAVLAEASRLVRDRDPAGLLMGEVDVEASRLNGYFNHGDGLNALLDFLVNNYLFLSFATESRAPILRGLRQLPPAPPDCQWVNFLRNLDELNLQWLSEQDRTVVWDTFAPDPAMRIYGRGIRRRLAPMLSNPEKIKMALSLLMSLPGAAMFVYGDEIGIGDNLAMPGREAVRPLMQWSGEENGGFSEAKREDLVRPLVTEGPFRFRRVNVENQQGDPDSILEAARSLIRTRQECPEIGNGQWHVIEGLPEQVFGHQCLWENSAVFLLHNLSGQEQEVRIDMRDRVGKRLTPLEGIVTLHPRMGDGEAYTAELPPYGYGWFRLVPEAEHVEQAYA